MSARPDVDRLVTEWLRTEASAAGSEPVLAAALSRVAVTGQERYVTQRLFGDRLGLSSQLRWAHVAGAALLALLAAAAIAGGLRPDPRLPGPGGFVPGPSLSVGRGGHSATLLPDGRLVVIGGLGGGVIPIDSVEVWDGRSAAFAAAAPLPLPRGNHTATLLPDGRILVVGNDGANREFADPASAALWDPATGAFTPTGSLAVPRWNHTATLLPDGRVLIVGGLNPVSAEPVAEAEIWDPATRAFSGAGAMAAARPDSTATLLPDGRVLVLGGGECDPARAELWEPATSSFRQTGSMAEGRREHTATLLPDGRVLIVGGSGIDGDVGVSEVWDSATGSFSPAGSLLVGRGMHTATLLPDGRVLVVGGAGEVATAELWDSGATSFRPAGTLGVDRAGHSATLLPDGRVLVIGGLGRSDPRATTAFWGATLPDTPRPSPTSAPVGPTGTPAPQPVPSEGGPAPTPNC